MAEKSKPKDAANLVKELFDEVKSDLRKEEVENAKALIKTKLASLARAKEVVANIEREVDDLKLKLAIQFKA